MLITLSGLDGSGKSTVAAWLRDELARMRRPATVLHMNDHVGVYASLRTLRDRLRGRSSRADPPRMEPHPSGLGRLRDGLIWSSWLRRLLVPVDILIFWCYRIAVERLGGRVLIMDRYFYDRLVDVAEGTSDRALRWLRRLAPVPDLAILLDLDAREAFARKGEYTVEYLQRRGEAYRRVFPRSGPALRISARAEEATRRAVARAVQARLVTG